MNGWLLTESAVRWDARRRSNSSTDPNEGFLNTVSESRIISATSP